MYALTSSMKGTTCRRFANMVCKKADIKVCRYSSHALDMKLSDDALDRIRDRTPNLPFQASSIFSVNSNCNFYPQTRNLSPAAASSVGDNTSTTITTVLPVDNSGGVARVGEVKKETKRETNVSVKINLNGSGVVDSNSGIPFLDEMLHEFASHGLFDVHVKATGDIDVDKRLTNEEVAHAFGMALKDAVGDNKDIKRSGSFIATHHDALIHAVLDLSGQPHLGSDSYYFNRVDTYGSGLLKSFFESLVKTSGMTLHILQLSGNDSNNIIKATFKAFAGALRQATEYDPRRRPLLPTSK